jgi:hypothetical protein
MYLSDLEDEEDNSLLFDHRPKQFTYNDPDTGETRTVLVTGKQKSAIKKYLKQRKSALKHAGANIPGSVPGFPGSAPFGGPSFGYPGGVPSFAPPLVGGGMPIPLSNPGSIMPNLPSMCGSTCSPGFGWIATVLATLVQQGRFCLSLDPENQVIPTSTQPLTLGYNDPSVLLQACLLAVQGDGTKNFAQALWAGADLTVAPATARVFGLRIRISNSVLNFKFGAYQMNFLDNATVRSTVLVQVRKLPVDLIILSISNTAGMATVVPTTLPGIQFLLASNPALVNGDVIYAETLNQRDIGNISTFATR